MKQKLKQNITTNKSYIIKNKLKKIQVFVLFSFKDIMRFLNYMFKNLIAKITNALKLNYYIKYPRSPTNFIF